MVTKVQKWGNSQGFRLSKELLEQAHIHIGDEVNVVVQKNMIILKPAHRVRGKYDLKNLVARMPKHYKPKEEDWGLPTGKEVW